MKPVMKLKKEVILRIRDLARNLHDSYADKPQSFDLSEEGEGITEVFPVSKVLTSFSASLRASKLFVLSFSD